MSSSSAPPSAPTPTHKWAGWLVTALLVLVAAGIFLVIYFTVSGPANTHFNALVAIGIVALVFGVASYLLQIASRQPVIQRALGWGFFGMGFATLFLTYGLAPNPDIDAGSRLIALLVLSFVLAITIALIAWRLRANAAQERLEAGRKAWQGRPAPSAYTYSTANPPQVSPPPTPANVPPTPPAAPPGAGGR